MDKKKNHFGTLLLKMCQANNLYIMNGRIGQDAKIGKCTTDKCTVIDYTISNGNFFQLVNDFCVLDFCKLYSDVHCPIVCQLKT